jgi:hypothetical protein
LDEKLDELRPEGAGGILGVGVKSVDIEKNANGEGSLLVRF